LRLRLVVAAILGTVGALGWMAERSGRPELVEAQVALLAPTPPMGWNSWDAYGTTVSEEDFKANAQWFAEHLKPFGWKYVVVDMEWFVTNPRPEGNSKDSQFSLDAYGRYTPAGNRFPAAAKDAGFRPLADYAHTLGLKFGIHILRGIPKQAVEKNLPIEGSALRASDAADTKDTCPWNPDNYGLDSAKPAAQAYYDSIARLYASWGVDFVKVDCIASRPYKGDEIRMLSAALRKTGRPILLSLSPGAAPIEKTEKMREYAELWRISDDVWDLWHSTVEYPQGLGDQFPRVAKWAPLVQAGHWPDADMLPIGYLGPAPGWGAPRQTRLTHDEQRTLLTLWSIFRSPLMVGANLTKNDAWTTSLLTNPEVIAVDQESSANRPVVTTEPTVVWTARTGAQGDRYVAVFSLRDTEQKIHYEWRDLGLQADEVSQAGQGSHSGDGGQAGKLRLRDLWERKDLGAAESLNVTLAPHGSALYRVSH
jgi:alpha-galactosidase